MVVHGKEIFLTDAGAGIDSAAPIIVIISFNTYYLGAKVLFVSLKGYVRASKSQLRGLNQVCNMQD